MLPCKTGYALQGRLVLPRRLVSSGNRVTFIVATAMISVTRILLTEKPNVITGYDCQPGSDFQFTIGA